MADLQQGQAGTWYVIYRTSDGAPMSETGVAPVDADLAALGLAKATLNHRPDPSLEQWDPVGHTVVARVAPTQTWQPPPASSSYRFTSYGIVDNPPAIAFTFYGPIPPGNRAGYVTVTANDAELAAAGTQPAVVTLVTNKLQRKLRATSIATKLDALIGQSVTI